METATPEESVKKVMLRRGDTCIHAQYNITLYVPGVFPCDQSCNKPGHHHDSQEQHGEDPDGPGLLLVLLPPSHYGGQAGD